MSRNAYDQASRYLAKLDPVGFLGWVFLGHAVTFHRWLDTRLIPFPGAPDRFCDTVAELEDPVNPYILWAVPTEFMLDPETELFGRLLSYLGQVWMEKRPEGERGDRYQVGAVVVNLRGKGSLSRTMALGKTGIFTSLGVLERDLEEEKAAPTLAGIASGSIAPCILALIPLMQGGGEDAIIQQWIQVASSEPDAKLRGDYGGLALVFAEAAGCRDAWKQALKGWNVIQSQQVLEWQAEAKAESVVEVLALKFGPLPQDLVNQIQGTTDLVRLKQWLAAAVSAVTLDDFRQTAKL